MPGLLRRGLVLPQNHLVLSEHFALPHSCACRHRHFLDACPNALVGKRGLKLVKAIEVGLNAGCWIPLLPVPLSLALKLLGRGCGHLDGHLVFKV
jgi:hypothetical protein